MTMTTDWQTRFLAVRERDLARYPDRRFLCRWAMSEELHRWTGTEDIRRWLEHVEEAGAQLDHGRWRLPMGDSEAKLIEASRVFNDAVLGRLFGSDAPGHGRLDLYNMTDWVLQHAYPRPLDERLERVLDFGAGFGRQAALWLSQGPRTTYVATDSVELPYLAQLHYLGSAPYAVREYLADPEGFAVEACGEPSALHLPGWRHDLLPSGFFDLAICVQVLPEIMEDVLFHWLSVFRRVLRPGGLLYIRQHAWQPAHKQELAGLLPALGFELEFQPRWRDRVDVHGLPQIWRRGAHEPATTPVQDRARQVLRGIRRRLRRHRHSRRLVA